MRPRYDANYHQAVKSAVDACDDAGTAVYGVRGAIYWLSSKAADYRGQCTMPATAAAYSLLAADLNAVLARYAEAVSAEEKETPNARLTH